MMHGQKNIKLAELLSQLETITNLHPSLIDSHLENSKVMLHLPSRYHKFQWCFVIRMTSGTIMTHRNKHFGAVFNKFMLHTKGAKISNSYLHVPRLFRRNS